MKTLFLSLFLSLSSPHESSIITSRAGLAPHPLPLERKRKEKRKKRKNWYLEKKEKGDISRNPLVRVSLILCGGKGIMAGLRGCQKGKSCLGYHHHSIGGFLSNGVFRGLSERKEKGKMMTFDERK